MPQEPSFYASRYYLQRHKLPSSSAEVHKESLFALPGSSEGRVSFGRLAHTKVRARITIDDATGLRTVEVRRTNDEIGDVEGQEAVAVETARVSLGQHKGLSNMALCIDMTEIGSREETIVTTGAEHEPAGVGAPVVERLRIVGVGTSHGTAFSRFQVEQPEVGLMVPDAELSVVRERIAQESSVVGGTGERDGMPHPIPSPIGRGL